MAVLDSNQTVSNNVSGFDKGIHASARTMMLDNLQGTMYQRPIDSAVRECVSNAIDAVKEKITAIKIKSGKAKVSDFYLTREDVKDKIANDEDDIYQDSEFAPDYYDLKYLSDDNAVRLQYINRSQTEKDQFMIHDPGVGLGGKRLEGFFSLGYSSKRLNANELGGFGLGAKSPLATGVESYRVISRYNGKEFCFDVYSHKVDCVYGKWGDNGNMNKSIEFESVKVTQKYVDDKGEVQTKQVPYQAYYKETKEKNGTTLIIDVKKHNKSKYMEAVRSQLMYVSTDMVFEEVSQTGVATNIPFKANIIYQDDDIIIPSTTFFTRPHFVIKEMCYGIIDFNEADLAVKQGNIGIKFNMEDLAVLPTREGVQYISKTTNAIVSKSGNVSKTVESRVQAELSQTELIDWLRACNKVMHTVGNGNSNDVVSRMSAFADNTQLNPTFANTGIKYKSDVKAFLTNLLKMDHISVEAHSRWSGSSPARKVNRVENTNIIGFDKPLYFQFGPSQKRVTSYLAHHHESVGGCCVIRLGTTYTYLEGVLGKYVANREGVDFTTTLAAGKVEISKVEGDAKKIAAVEAHWEKMLEVVSMIKNSKNAQVCIYDDVIVPAGFKGDEVVEAKGVVSDGIDYEALAEAKRKAKYKEALKRRRENQQFVGYKLANKKVNSYYYKAGFERSELSVEQLDFDNCMVAYGTDTEDSAFNLMIDLAKQRGESYDNQAETYYWGDDVKVVKVAKTNLRYVKSEGTPVEEYLLNIEDGTLRATEEVRRALTSKAIYEIVNKKSTFLRNFKEINPEIADSWTKLNTYIRKAPNVSIFSTPQASDNKYVKLFGSYYDVNLAFIKYEHLTEDERTELLDGVDTSQFDIDVLDVSLIDREIYEEALKLEGFAEVYGNIFKHIDVLSGTPGKKVDSDLIVEIKDIISAKKDQLEFTYEGVNK